jgi:hypothetical protein
MVWLSKPPPLSPRYFRCCPGCLGRGQPRRRGRHQQPPFTPTSPSRLLNLSLSPPPVPNLAAVEELVVDVLAAGLAYLLELLVVGLIRQILAAQ